jgi:hypothetical protein
MKLKIELNIMKRESGKLHLTEQMMYVLTKNEKVKDPGTVANSCIIFF